jgi:hypothetical protein
MRLYQILRIKKIFSIVIIVIITIFFYNLFDIAKKREVIEQNESEINAKENHKIEKINKEHIPKNINNFIETSVCVSNVNSVCFFGKRFCHPAYTGELCDQRIRTPNKWYIADCPNLSRYIGNRSYIEYVTYKVDMPLSKLSSGKECEKKNIDTISGCAHLCFSHPSNGIPQIPISLYEAVKLGNNSYWKTEDYKIFKAQEVIEGFNNFTDLPGI